MNLNLKGITLLTLAALLTPTSNFADDAQNNGANVANTVATPQGLNNVSDLSAADQLILRNIDLNLTPVQQAVLTTWISNNMATNGAVPGVLANFQTMLTGLNNNGSLAIEIFQNNENSASLGSILTAAPAQYTAAQAIASNPVLTAAQQQQVIAWVTGTRINPNLTGVLQAYQTALTNMAKMPATLQTSIPALSLSLFAMVNNAVTGSGSATDIQNAAAAVQAFVSAMTPAAGMSSRNVNDLFPFHYYQQTQSLGYQVNGNIQSWNGLMAQLLQDFIAHPQAASVINQLLSPSTLLEPNQSEVLLASVLYNIQKNLPSSLQDNVALLQQGVLQSNVDFLQQGIVNYIQANITSPNLVAILTSYNQAVTAISAQKMPANYTAAQWSAVQQNELTALNTNPAIAQNPSAFTTYISAAQTINALPSTLNAATVTALQNGLLSLLESTNATSTDLTNYAAAANVLSSLSLPPKTLTDLVLKGNYYISEQSMLGMFSFFDEGTQFNANNVSVPVPAGLSPPADTGQANYPAVYAQWFKNYNAMTQYQSILSQNPQQFLNFFVNIVTGLQYSPPAYAALERASPTILYELSNGNISLQSAINAYFPPNYAAVMQVYLNQYGLSGSYQTAYNNFQQKNYALYYYQQAQNLAYEVNGQAQTWNGLLNQFASLLQQQPQNATNIAASLNSLPNILYGIQYQVTAALLTPAQAASWQASLVNYVVQNSASPTLATTVATWDASFANFFSTLNSYQTQKPPLSAAVNQLWAAALQQMMTLVQQNPQNITIIAPAASQLLTAVQNIQTNLATTYPTQAAQLQAALLDLVENNTSNPSLESLVQSYAASFSTANIKALMKQTVNFLPTTTVGSVPTQSSWQTVLGQLLTLVAQNPSDAQTLMAAAQDLPAALNAAASAMQSIATKYNLTTQQTSALQQSILTYVENNVSSSDPAATVTAYTSALKNLGAVLNSAHLSLSTGIQSAWDSDVQQIISTIATTPADATILAGNVPALENVFKTINHLSTLQPPLQASDISALITQVNSYLTQNASNTAMDAGKQINALNSALSSFASLYQKTLPSNQQPLGGQSWTALLATLLPSVYSNIGNAVDTVNAMQALPAVFEKIHAIQASPIPFEPTETMALTTALQQKLSSALITYLTNTASSYGQTTTGTSGTLPSLASLVTNYGNAVVTLTKSSNYYDIVAGETNISQSEVMTWLMQNPGNAENIVNAFQQLSSLINNIATLSPPFYPMGINLTTQMGPRVAQPRQGPVALDIINEPQQIQLAQALVTLIGNNAGATNLPQLMTNFSDALNAIKQQSASSAAKTLKALNNGAYWTQIINAVVTTLSSSPSNAANIAAGMSQIVLTLNGLYQIEKTNNQSSNTQGAVFLPASLVSSVIGLLENNANNSSIATVFSNFNANVQQFNTLLAGNPILSTGQAAQMWTLMAANQSTTSMPQLFNTMSNMLSSINQLSSVQTKTALTQDFFNYAISAQSNAAFNGLVTNFSSMMATVANNQNTPSLLTSFQALMPALMAAPNLSLATSTALTTLLTAQANNPALPDIATQIAAKLSTVSAFQLDSMNTYITNHPTATSTQVWENSQTYSLPNLLQLMKQPMVAVPSSILTGSAAQQALQVYNTANQQALAALNTSIMPALLSAAQATTLGKYLAANPAEIQPMYHAIIAASIANQLAPNTTAVNGQTLVSMQQLNSMMTTLGAAGFSTVGDLTSLISTLNNPELGLPANFRSGLQTVTQAVAANASLENGLVRLSGSTTYQSLSPAQQANYVCQNSPTTCNISSGSISNYALTFPYSANQETNAMISTMAIASPQQLLTLLTNIKGIPGSLNTVISTLVNKNLISAAQMPTFMSALTLYGQLQTAKASGNYAAMNASLENNPQQDASLLSFLSTEGAKYNAYKAGTTLQAQYQQAVNSTRSSNTTNFWLNTLNTNQNPFNVITTSVRGGDQSGFYTRATANFDAAYYYYLAGGNYSNTPLSAAQQATLMSNAQSFAQSQAKIMSSCGSGIKGFDCTVRHDFDAVGSAIKGMFSGDSVGDIFRDMAEGVAAVGTFGTYDMLAGSFLASTAIPMAAYEGIDAGLATDSHLGDLSAAFSDIAGTSSVIGLAQLAQAYIGTCQSGPGLSCFDTMSTNMTFGMAASLAAPFNMNNNLTTTQRVIGGLNDLLQIGLMVAGGDEESFIDSLNSTADKLVGRDLTSITDPTELTEINKALDDTIDRFDTLINKGNGNGIDVESLTTTKQELESFQDQVNSAIDAANDKINGSSVDAGINTEGLLEEEFGNEADAEKWQSLNQKVTQYLEDNGLEDDVVYDKRALEGKILYRDAVKEALGKNSVEYQQWESLERKLDNQTRAFLKSNAVASDSALVKLSPETLDQLVPPLREANPTLSDDVLANVLNNWLSQVGQKTDEGANLVSQLNSLDRTPKPGLLSQLLNSFQQFFKTSEANGVHFSDSIQGSAHASPGTASAEDDPLRGQETAPHTDTIHVAAPKTPSSTSTSAADALASQLSVPSAVGSNPAVQHHRGQPTAQGAVPASSVSSGSASSSSNQNTKQSPQGTVSISPAGSDAVSTTPEKIKKPLPQGTVSIPAVSQSQQSQANSNQAWGQDGNLGVNGAILPEESNSP